MVVGVNDEAGELERLRARVAEAEEVADVQSALIIGWANAVAEARAILDARASHCLQQGCGEDCPFAWVPVADIRRALTVTAVSDRIDAARQRLEAAEAKLTALVDAVTPLMDRDVVSPYGSSWEICWMAAPGIDGEAMYDALRAAWEAARRDGAP